MITLLINASLNNLSVFTFTLAWFNHLKRFLFKTVYSSLTTTMREKEEEEEEKKSEVK
jgi:hypothetical protein